MKKNKLFGFTLLALLLLVLAACSSTSDTGSKESTTTTSSETKSETDSDLSKVTIRVAQTGWASYEELFKASGLDKDIPYTVEYSVFQGGNLILEAMNAGHVDLGGTSEIPPIFSALSENGAKSRVIGISSSNTLNQELVVPKDSPIKSVADLKGKKVAYVNNTTAQYFLVKMLEEAGLTWDDIDAKQLTTADGLTALIGGNVDALASYGNAIISSKENGATTLASAKDILSGNFQLNANVDAINDPGKHAAIADYLGRLDKANEWQRENLKKWAEITAKNTKQPVETALKTIQEGEEQRATKILPLSEEAKASQQDIVKIFYSIGVLQEELDVKTFWSHDFDEEIAEFSK